MKPISFKRFVTSCIALLLIFGLCTCAYAESFDLSSMSYDELIVLRDQAESRIKDLERQYAIENGNRVITFDQESVTLFIKQTQTLTPQVKRIVEDAPENTAFLWSSSDESIAAVSSKGVVSAVAQGNAIITCTAEDDEYIFATVPVHVGLRVESVSLSTEELTLHLSDGNPGEASYLLSAAVSPENALCQNVIWTTSDENIATVNEDGLIQAVNPGTVTIRATSTEEVGKDQKPKTRSCMVTVIQDVASITLSETALNIKKSGTSTLKASVLPENASNKKVFWESSDTSIATVSSEGLVTAKSCGTCTITCKAADGTEICTACEVTVFQPVTSLKSAQISVNAFIDSEPTHIDITVSPEDATDKTLAWTSSDPSIAAVDESGNVIAVSGGSCKIICSTCDGTNKSAEISILVPSISVEKTDYTVTEKSGLSIPLKYYGQDIRNLTVTVADKRFFTASLDINDEENFVKIKPEKAGTTTITLNDGSGEKNAVKLSVEVAHSAVYDSTSYPTASYEDILRNPDKHNGEQYQIYGKVLQKIEGSFYNALRVGTSGRYYDSVFYVTYIPAFMDENIIEDDYVTIYGTCDGTETYKTVMGASVTIPSMTAEKIKIGKKK